MITLQNLMKKLLFLACVLAGLMLPMGAVVQAQSPYYQEHHEHHGQISAAIHALEEARECLLHSRHDYGGHREMALRSVDNAMEQLRIAESFDRH